MYFTMQISVGKGSNPPPTSFDSYEAAFGWAYGYYVKDKGMAPADAMRTAKEFADGMAEGLGLPRGPKLTNMEQAEAMCLKYTGKPISHYVSETIPFVAGAVITGLSAAFGMKMEQQQQKQAQDTPNPYDEADEIHEDENKEE